MARPTETHQRFVYERPHPAVTVDCVVFGLSDGELRLLLIRRGEAPFAGSWALPGGFVRMDETTDEAVLRELEEETGASRVYVEQLYTFSAVDRDPRERVISVGYCALVRPDAIDPVAGADAADARWFPTTHLPELAFDHGTLVLTALERLRSKVRVQPLGFELLPRRFTLRPLQQLYEAVLGRDPRVAREGLFDRRAERVVAHQDAERLGDVAGRGASVESTPRPVELRQDGSRIGAPGEHEEPRVREEPGNDVQGQVGAVHEVDDAARV